MFVYGNTQKRFLEELLHDHGISVQYDKTLQISAHSADSALNRIMDEGVMYTLYIEKGCFTTVAMDNINLYLTNTTSFHGTSLSLHQYPTSDNEGEKPEPIRIRDIL